MLRACSENPGAHCTETGANVVNIRMESFLVELRQQLFAN